MSRPSENKDFSLEAIQRERVRINSGQWKPRADTQRLLDFCLATIHSVPYKPNLRWVMYRALQASYLPDKSKKSMHKFDNALSVARKTFYQGWKPDILEDSVRQSYWHGEFFADYDVKLENIENQESIVQLWYEAYAMHQQFQYYSAPYRVSLVPFRGDCSIPIKWQLAKKMEQLSETYGKPIEVKYFGDLDDKGLKILNAALKDIRAWCRVPFTVERVGLTLDPQGHDRHSDGGRATRMKDKEETKSVRGIVSDVPSDAVEHAKMVHRWAEAHPQWKRQHVADKPKIKNRCGDCAGFRTTFCTWNTQDGPGVTENDDACGNYFARPRIRTGRQFEKAVKNL